MNSMRNFPFLFPDREEARFGLRITAAALLLGLLADILLRATPWGINVALWVASLGVLAGWLIHTSKIEVAGDGWWLAWLAPVFALTFAWRDSPTLLMGNGMAFMAVLALAALRFRTGSLRTAAITEYTSGTAHLLTHTVNGSAKLFSQDIRWHEIPREQWIPDAKAVGRGFALGFPLVIVFGILFASADAAFEQITISFLDWLFTDLFVHTIVVTVVAWLGGGFLRQTLFAPEWHPSQDDTAGTWAIGPIEISVILGLLNILFLTFVLVQLPYFFGGLQTVATSPGLTVAEYARRGFFELVTVSALVLPLLLFTHWLLHRESMQHEYLFRGLAGALIVQLLVIMASAFQRMWFYQTLFGLTELRFYTTVFMLWLAIIFAWFVMTVLRGHRERFAFGVLISGCVVVVVLNCVNPDAVIARTNVYRDTASSSLDCHYVATLSADAVPTLITALPALGEEKRHILASLLRLRWASSTREDWRTWNWSRTQAWQQVTETKLEMTGSPTPAWR